MLVHLASQAQSWIYPRSLFDAAIEYLSSQRVAIPGYSVLQDIIGQVVSQVRDELILLVDHSLSDELKANLSDLVSGKGQPTLMQLRQSAKSFKTAELNKELTVHHQIQSWMPEVRSIVSELSLSLKNQQHFASRVDYYGSKLKRQKVSHLHLYFLCYLLERWQKNLERIPSRFVSVAEAMTQRCMALDENKES